MKRLLFLITTALFFVSCKGTEVGNGLKPKDEEKNPDAPQATTTAENTQPGDTAKSQADHDGVWTKLRAIGNPCFHPFSSVTESPLTLVGTDNDLIVVTKTDNEWKASGKDGASYKFVSSEALDPSLSGEKICRQDNVTDLEATAQLNQRKRHDVIVFIDQVTFHISWVVGINANALQSIEAYTMSDENDKVLYQKRP